ncbi:hypothetical protein NDU88_000285 [Pleurodeles waltl]|uniref:Uncharacterized protein n=1 Tax=Pleurodeles waltl TaxID=8319 RepID=A0AAV7P2D0_PLEWA|nr:hypothetical protein NDU88_000285 [Pleurodeles waltl]
MRLALPSARLDERKSAQVCKVSLYCIDWQGQCSRDPRGHDTDVYMCLSWGLAASVESVTPDTELCPSLLQDRGRERLPYPIKGLSRVQAARNHCLDHSSRPGHRDPVETLPQGPGEAGALATPR